MSSNLPASLRAVVIGLGSTAAAVSMTACSSSNHHSTAADASFVSKANAICAAAVAQHAGHELPVAHFDPLHPDPADLPAIGRYFARYGAARDTAARLDALAAPADQQAAWAKLRGLIDRAAANATTQIAAAERSDVAAFEQTVSTARSLADQIDPVGQELGFSSGSPCRKVFG